MADSVVKLKIDDKEYNASLRSAKQGLAALEQSMQQAGKSFVDVDKKVVDYVRELGKMNTQAVTSKGKISEMTAAFTEYGMVYKRMTDQEKASPVGKAMAQSLDQLKTRIVQAKADLVDLNKQLMDNGDATEMAADESTNFGSVLQSLGSQLGINTNLLSSLTTGANATAAAVASGAVAVGLATKAWADYNNELNRQNTMTSVVTGGKGDEELTVGVRALAKTYDVDFRQAIEAANTLMQQFGVTSTEALRLLQDGMQGMIAGDGGKLLSMIQQYAPSFRDAGIEASQLVAIIQNSEGGIFTDQNMNAIVMGIRNIRLMTEQTSKALAQLGIDGEEMTRKLNDGTMTIFEAMQQVSKAIEDAGTSSQAVGQVMQQVFGRQGTAAGTNLAKAIETLNTNLEETKTQTGDLGESFVKLNEANERLESTMQDIFGMTGWEDMNNYLKTDLANTLSDILDIIGGIKKAIGDLSSYGESVWNDVVARFTGEAYKGKGGKGKVTVTPKPQDASGQWQWGNGKYDFNYTPAPSAQAPATPAKSGYQVVTSGGKVVKITRDGVDVTNEVKNPSGNTTPTVTNPVTPKGVGGRKETPWAPIAMGEFTGLDLSVAPMAVNWGDAYTHDFKKDLKNLKMPEETKTDKTMVGELQKITGGVEGVFSGMQQLGVEIPEGLSGVISGIQGVTSILTSIAAICTVIQTLTTLQTARSAIPFFAHGGIVPHAATGMIIPGNDFSDRTPVLASSGELILNKAQQGNLAAQLTSMERGGGAVSTPSYVRAEDVFLGVNNYLRRKGRGELVTTRRRS